VTQLGGLTQTGKQNRVFNIICHHTGCWWGKLAGGKAVAAQKRTGHRAVRVALCIPLFVLYILLIRIVVVTVYFVCCSVTALILTHQFLPFSFHSPPHPRGGRGGRVTAWPYVAGHSQTDKIRPSILSGELPAGNLSQSNVKEILVGTQGTRLRHKRGQMPYNPVSFIPTNRELKV